MHLRLVSAPAAASVDSQRVSHIAPRLVELDDYPFAETLLTVAFACTEDLSAVREGGRVALATMPEISQDDAYLVLPLRAREGLVAAFAKGAVGRVMQWFEEAVVVRAELDGGRAPKLWVGAAWRAADVLATQTGRPVAMDGAGDALRVVNQLPFMAGLAPGGLLDRRGVVAIAGAVSYVGVSRLGIDDLGLGADAVEPTFVWTEREGLETRVKVALSASEDDCVVALLAPLTLLGAG